MHSAQASRSAFVLIILVYATRVCSGIDKESQMEVFAKSKSDNVRTSKMHIQCTDKRDCGAPWMRCENNLCVCSGYDFFTGLLTCRDQNISVLSCNCMTYEKHIDKYYVGACIENCMGLSALQYDNVYHPTFSPSANVTRIMCEKYNRGGRLCGKCLNGFSPQAYSSNITCVQCPDGNKNLWKYFLASLAPLTCFYFLILFFKINTTSSYLHGYVLFAQVFGHPAFGRLISLTIETLPTFAVPADIVLILYGVWNLNFFLTFDTVSICLDMSPLTVRALDYTIAVYPFFLTVISYFLIELHERNCKIVVSVWRPFRFVFTLYRRNWDIRTSIIDAYATFYQLSFIKIICITQDLLTPTYAYIVGESESSAELVLFFDGTVDYFGPEHLPYVIPAIVIALLCIILPLLLLLVYPCRCFQRFMNYCHISSPILQTFMVCFQCCYKDGTESGTRDCRWFAAFDLFTRIIFCITYSFILSILFFPLACIMLFVVIILVINIQPYNSQAAHLMKIDFSFYCFIGMLFASLSSAYIASINSHRFVSGLYVLVLVTILIPLAYTLCYSVHWLFSRRRWGRSFINRVRARWRGYSSLEDTLPDRLMNPSQYQAEQRLEDTVDMTANHQCEDSTGRAAGHLYTD